MLNEIIQKNYHKAECAELFAAAKCNMDCIYCYIPKNVPILDTTHRKIIEEIKRVFPNVERKQKRSQDNGGKRLHIYAGLKPKS